MRDTFISDPPCKEIDVGLDYEARPSRPGFYFLGVHTAIRSDKPLTIGDAVDRALQSKIMWTLDTKTQRESTRVTEDITAAEKIIELEKQHDCRIVLQAFYVTLALNNTVVRPLPLTDAGYVRYKPKDDESLEIEPLENDSSGDSSSSSEDGSSEDDSTGE